MLTFEVKVTTTAVDTDW